MLRRALIALALVPLTGCGNEETAPIDPGPTGNPTLAISFPPPGSGVCLQTLGDVDAQAPFIMNVEQFMLRPPGACGQFAQCGRLALYTCPWSECREPLPGEEPLLPVLNNESSVRAIELLLGKLADPYHDGAAKPDGDDDPGNDILDLLHLRIALLKDNGTLASDHSGQPLRTELSLVSLPECCSNLALEANLTVSGAGDSTSINDGGGESACAEDGCLACGSEIDTATAGTYVEYEWAAPVTVGSIAIDTGNCRSGCESAALASGDVLYWDGEAWQVAQSFAAEDDVWLTISPPVRTTKLRLENLTAGSCGGKPATIYEWAVYPWAGCVTPE